MDEMDGPQRFFSYYFCAIMNGNHNHIHIGHLILAQNALEYCGLDEVFIMPSGVSYLKDPADILRQDLLRHAASKFILNFIEINVDIYARLCYIYFDDHKNRFWRDMT